MKPSAVLLIDLENFYCSREDYRPGGYDRARFGDDLEKLLGFAREMADGLPFTVRRAYADFNSVRYVAGAPPQYFLRNVPDELLRQGVEPVQVFRLSKGGGRSSKNAADMRMAMDATALLASAGHVEHFVLVTGDADFIPVILELKRHGLAVSVIGVTGATNELIQRFVDNFELFEDLLAAEEVEVRSRTLADTSDGIAQVATAVHALLGRSRPLRFAAVKPLLSKELGRTFDPGEFGCDTTGDFLRKFQKELGVEIRPTANDQEIDLPGAVPGVNGSSSKLIARAVRPADRKPDAPEPHTAAHYQQLLGGRGPTDSPAGSVKVPPVPWPVLIWGCEKLTELLAPPAGSPARSVELLPRLLLAAEGVAIPDLVRCVRMVYPTLRAGLPPPGPSGLYALPTDAAPGSVRREVLRYVAFVLTMRLREAGVEGAVRPDALQEAFTPGAPAEALADYADALTEVVSTSPPPAPKSLPSPDDYHSPAGYARLLRAGGARGTESELLKVQPVPWGSVERVCADVYSILSPSAGGGPLANSQLVARLLDSGRRLGIEKYDQHVRRTLTTLRLANIIYDEGPAVVLHPEVTSTEEVCGYTLKFVLDLLRMRLDDKGISDPIRPEVFAAAMEAGHHTERLRAAVAGVLALVNAPESDVIAVTEDTPTPDRRTEESGNRTLTDPATGPDPLSLDDGSASGSDDVTPPVARYMEPESPSGVLSVVDVARITREAVAEANNRAREAPVVATFTPPDVPGSDMEPFAPRVESPVQPILLSLDDDPHTTAVPVGEWLTDDDVLGIDPAPLPPAPASGVAKMNVAPAPAPHTPPPPPETA